MLKRLSLLVVAFLMGVVISVSIQACAKDDSTLPNQTGTSNITNSSSNSKCDCSYWSQNQLESSTMYDENGDIERYNEQSETSFTENIDNFELEPEEITHITDSLVESLNSNDKNLQNSSSEVLNELIDKSLSENNSSIIDTIIKSADANLSQVQKLINDGDLMNKIDTSMDLEFVSSEFVSLYLFIK